MFPNKILSSWHFVVAFQEKMGYKEGAGLGKARQGPSKLLDNIKQEQSIKDEKIAVQNDTSQPESAYSDFAQRQMVCQ